MSPASQTNTHPKILTFQGRYLPGYQSGGPVRSIAGMVDRLGDHLNFCIVTNDRDKTDSVPYPQILVDDWNRVGKGQVYYASPDSLNLRKIRELIHRSSPDVLYVNSFFARLSMRVLLLRWLKLIDSTPVVLAPRGEFSHGALGLKSGRKRLYVKLMMAIGFYRNIIWHASSEQEKQDIERALGRQQIKVASNLAMSPEIPSHDVAEKPIKQAGVVRFIFLSRVVAMKNLQHALTVLKSIKGEVILDIYGPTEDAAYFKQCEAIVADLPHHIHVQFKGGVAHQEVRTLLSQYHFLILPTLGENFGHIILEALANGCPPIISDRTTWRKLAEHDAGWDINLDDREAWRATLQACVDMDVATYRRVEAGASYFANKWYANSLIVEQNLELFRFAAQTADAEGSTILKA